MTDSVEGIRAIKAAQGKSAAIVAVVHQMRFVPLHRKIKASLEQGAVGRMCYLEGYYVHNLTQRAFDAVTEMMVAVFRAGAERL